MPSYLHRIECTTALMYWLRFALSDPHEFLYAVPRRFASRAFGRHSTTCRGLPAPHPRSW